MNNTLNFHNAIAQLKAACESGLTTDNQIVDLCKEVVRLDAERQLAIQPATNNPFANIPTVGEQLDKEEARLVKAGKPVFRAEVYLVPEQCELFSSDKSFCRAEAQKGANFGVDYKEEQAIFRVVVSDPGDEEDSWNNDGVPRALADAMGWKGKVNFPEYLPITLVGQLVRFDGVSLVLPEATIELVPMKQQGRRYNQSIADAFGTIKAHSCNSYKSWAAETEAGKHFVKTDVAEDWYKAGLVCQQLGTIKDANECYHRAMEHGSKLAELKLGYA